MREYTMGAVKYMLVYKDEIPKKGEICKTLHLDPSREVRYIIVRKNDNSVLDTCGGYGFKSMGSARSAYIYLYVSREDRLKRCADWFADNQVFWHNLVTAKEKVTKGYIKDLYKKLKVKEEFPVETVLEVFKMCKPKHSN